MADRTPSDLAKAEDLRLMLHSSGWQQALALIFAQLRQHEASLSPQYTDPQRWDAIGRRGMLLDLLTLLYRDAELPSPLETHYVQFLGSVTPPLPTPPTVRPQEAQAAALPPDPRRVRRQAGSVA